MLLTRVVTALIAGPLLVALIVWGPIWAFSLFTMVLVGLALHEFYAMTRPDAPRWTSVLGIVVGMAIAAAWLFVLGPFLAMAVATLGTLLLLLAHLTLAGQLDRAAGWLTASLGGLLYCVFTLTHLGLLRRLELVLVPGQDPDRSWRIVLLVLVLSFASDTAAYFTGRALGRHPFAPRISPKKTWEGTVGGLVGSTAACFAWRWVMPELSVVDAIVLGLGAGFLGQLGDLAESLIKRSTGVKDSGKLLPGHGGVLDRFDAVSFSAPLVYYYYFFFVSGQPIRRILGNMLAW